MAKADRHIILVPLRSDNDSLLESLAWLVAGFELGSRAKILFCGSQRQEEDLTEPYSLFAIECESRDVTVELKKALEKLSSEVRDKICFSEINIYSARALTGKTSIGLSVI